MNPPPLRCAISDRHWGGGDQTTSLLRQAERLSRRGIDFFQLREKDLPAGELARSSRSLLAVLGGSWTRLLINGRADVAVAVGAHGIHLTSHPDELTPAQVHKLYTEAKLPGPLVTASCHTLDDVERRRMEGVDAILFGPVFEKAVKGQRHMEGSGLAALQDACLAADPVPVLALGGVTAENAGLCLEAGARGVAGIRLFQFTD